MSAPIPDIPILSAGILKTLSLYDQVLAEYLAETGQVIIREISEKPENKA